MALNPKVSAAISDPEFLKLTHAERKEALSIIDPGEFGGMNSADQDEAVFALSNSGKSDKHWYDPSVNFVKDVANYHGARNTGYSDNEIVNHLSLSGPPESSAIKLHAVSRYEPTDSTLAEGGKETFGGRLKQAIAEVPLVTANFLFGRYGGILDKDGIGGTIVRRWRGESEDRNRTLGVR